MGYDDNERRMSGSKGTEPAPVLLLHFSLALLNEAARISRGNLFSPLSLSLYLTAVPKEPLGLCRRLAVVSLSAEECPGCALRMG